MGYVSIYFISKVDGSKTEETSSRHTPLYTIKLLTMYGAKMRKILRRATEIRGSPWSTPCLPMASRSWENCYKTQLRGLKLT